MRDKNRIKPLLELIESIWEQYPDLRLGQLMTNAAHKSGWRIDGLFFIEDDLLKEGLENLLMEFKNE
jgi:uncharacterized protein YihD (DUF1040 family)